MFRKHVISQEIAKQLDRFVVSIGKNTYIFEINKKRDGYRASRFNFNKGIGECINKNVSLDWIQQSNYGRIYYSLKDTNSVYYGG